jgi:alkylhydroperoxidase family enzyme
MARIPYPEIKDSPPKIQEFFARIKANNGRIMNVNLMMVHSPGSVRELIRLGNRLLTKAGLDHKYRELAIIKVSYLCGSNYEWAQHIPIALRSGVTTEQIEDIENWSDSDKFSEEEKTILAFTEEVVRDSAPSEQTFQEAAAFLDDTSLVELTFSIGYWSMIAKFLKTFQVDIEEEFLAKNKHLFPSNMPGTQDIVS